MKCRLLAEKEVLEFYPGTDDPHAPMELVVQCVRRDGRLFAPPGTLIDDPQCWRIVLMGQAEAADDECREKTAQTPEQRAATLHAGKRLAAGIDPEDFDKYDAGEILGYDAAGNYVPGPNWRDEKQESDTL